MDAFHQIQRAFKRHVDKHGGLETIPLHNDRLRPILLLMQEVGEKHHTGVFVFDFAGPDDPATKVYLGLINDVRTTIAMMKEITERLMADPALGGALADTERGRLVMKPSGGGVVIYCDDLWVPAGALRPN